MTGHRHRTPSMPRADSSRTAAGRPLAALMPTVGVLAIQGDFEAHARVLGSWGPRPARCGPRQDLDGIEALVIPGGESTTMTLGIEREGLAEPLRALVSQRHACARHLRGADRAGPRPPRAAGPALGAQRVGPAGRKLRGRRRRAGARRPDYGEYSSGRHGSRSTGRASRCWQRWTAIPWPSEKETSSRWRSTPRSRRHAPARVAAHPGEREEWRGRVRDQRAEALAQILVRYSTKVVEGDVCVIQGTTTAEPLIQASTRRFCAPGACRSSTSRPRSRPRRSTGWRPTSSWSGCRPRRSGRRRTPTCGSC